MRLLLKQLILLIGDGFSSLRAYSYRLRYACDVRLAASAAARISSDGGCGGRFDVFAREPLGGAATGTSICKRGKTPGGVSFRRVGRGSGSGPADRE
jgi:hypothetical protein